MDTIVLTLLIINFMCSVLFACDLIVKNKQNICKRWNKSESELQEIKSKLLEDNEKYPVKTKYKLNDTVFAKNNNFTYNGKIIALIVKKDNKVEYMVDYQGRTITVSESDVYLENY